MSQIKLSILDLPRELYLEVCSYLTVPDLTRTARLCRDHYLAVQQPLYTDIKIETHSKLIKLVETLTKTPTVSHISPQQRLRWFKLSNAELRGREIKYLKLVIGSISDPENATGAVLSRCVGVISRHSPAVKITLTLNGLSEQLMKQLQQFSLPNVSKVIVYASSAGNDTVISQHPSAFSFRNRLNTNDGMSSAARFWDLLFSDSTFTDLRSAFAATACASREGLPRSVAEAIDLAIQHHSSHDQFSRKMSEEDNGSLPFHGLRHMEEIIIAHNNYLDVASMQSLFGSTVIPQRLTKLEIVGCPQLHPIKDLTALSTLLSRALQLVKHFKLHLYRQPTSSWTDWETRYAERIEEHPEEHLCNIVRGLSKRLRSLDLALPFVCIAIFDRPFKERFVHPTGAALGTYPTVLFEPYNTLKQRLLAEGYDYRRVICMGNMCPPLRGWQEMIGCATQSESDKTSWEMMLVWEDQGSWHMPGGLTRYFEAEDVLTRPFVDDA
ncbi:hypothetical protein B0A50_08265 [Salinomyces thailandicus]|uniref:F-box domain-containing protein n=1 Tax=Salinomyces thailandicus TaxID=706561 RepID=A0A4U0TKG3_9PEZI|nr:hypothetical protein B0A50_08265 [Salinomyces thailandica]